MQLYVLDPNNRKIRHKATTTMVTGRVLNRSFVWPVPDHVSVDDSALTDLGFTLPNVIVASGLVDQSISAGLLAADSSYSSVLAEPCLSDAGMDVPNSQDTARGDYGKITLRETGVYQSAMKAMASTPASCTLHIAVGTWTRTQSGINAVTKAWSQETVADHLLCEVSTDNGGNFNAVTPGVPFNIPGADQGNQLIVKLTNNIKVLSSRVPILVNWWSLLY